MYGNFGLIVHTLGYLSRCTFVLCSSWWWLSAKRTSWCLWGWNLENSQRNLSSICAWRPFCTAEVERIRWQQGWDSLRVISCTISSSKRQSGYPRQQLCAQWNREEGWGHSSMDWRDSTFIWIDGWASERWWAFGLQRLENRVSSCFSISALIMHYLETNHLSSVSEQFLSTGNTKSVSTISLLCSEELIDMSITHGEVDMSQKRICVKTYTYSCNTM